MLRLSEVPEFEKLVLNSMNDVGWTRTQLLPKTSMMSGIREKELEFLIKNELIHFSKEFSMVILTINGRLMKEEIKKEMKISRR